MRSLKVEACYGFFRDIFALVHSTANVREFMEVLVWKVSEMLDAKGSLLWVRNLETDQLELQAACGLSESSESRLYNVPVINTRAASEPHDESGGIPIEDMAGSPQIQYLEDAADEGMRMMLDLPITVKENLIGVIRVFFTENRAFSAEDTEFFIAIARQCACAINTARVFEEQQNRYDQLALQTEKLSALGRMAAGIAHEINNPLTGILLYSTNLRKKVQEDGALKEGLDIIIKETKRCRGIIEGLLECSREKQPWRSETYLNDIIEDALNLLENVFHLNHITVQKDISTDIPKCFVDKDQIEQAVINLLLNSVEAISERGTITVRSHVSYNGNFLVCEVEDTGCGISQEDLPKIFDPFFSTKSKGTGLGLSVTYAIMKNHQGDLKVFSRKGEGARFVFEIPISYQGPINEGPRG